MGKKVKSKQVPQYDAQNQDQFSLSQSGQNKNNGKLKGSTMKSIFDQILAEQDSPKKQVKQKKQQKMKVKMQSKEKKIQKVKNKKTKILNQNDLAFKYIDNKKLQKDLKNKTLNGVVKMMNLISAHKKNLTQQ